MQTIAIFIYSVSLGGAPPPAGDAEPLSAGDRLQPIVDRFLIERTNGAALRLHAPCRREAVFSFDAAWEGPQSGYVTIMPAADAGGVKRMYYRGGGDLSREYTCVAESRDGIHWTRPVLRLVEFNGSKENNIILTARRKAYGESHNFCPFRDANPAAAADQKYKAVGLAWTPEGPDKHKALAVFASADGLRWRRLKEEPVIVEGGFDSQNVAFWDSVQKQYVCYIRVSREGKRSIARCTSADFVTWSRPQPLDFGESPLEHLYTNGILAYFRAPHVYLGLPLRFVPPGERGTVGFEPRKTDGLSDAVFMSSHDGQHWDRTFMEAFIRPGLDPGSWGGAHGNSTPAWGILQTGPAELSIYWSEGSDNYPEKKTAPCLRRGTLRVDGFVSVNAAFTGGEFTTRPLVYDGGTLFVNLSTSAVGSLRVEMQDASGRPLPGLSLAESTEIWGDEIARRVGWKGGADLRAWAGRPVRLRFVMKDADLYAFQFRN
jgi:hypothetical protein